LMSQHSTAIPKVADA